MLVPTPIKRFSTLIDLFTIRFIIESVNDTQISPSRQPSIAIRDRCLACNKPKSKENPLKKCAYFSFTVNSGCI